MDNAQQDRSAQLLRYLDKEMNREEQLAFETALLADEQLRSELESLRAARQSILLYGIKEQVAQIHKEERSISKETPVIKMPVYWKYIKYGIAVAACLVLIFVAVDRYSYNKLSADSLFAEQFTSFEPSNTRGASVEITAIEKAYTEKNYKEVIALYRPTDTVAPRQMIMVGIAYLQAAHAADAINVLQSLLAKNKTNNITSFNDEASYYLALAYLKNKDYSHAIDLMETIQADKENKYNDKFSTTYIDKVKKLQSK